MSDGITSVLNTEKSGVVKGLEEASQQHEQRIVIDLGVDRLVNWIATYIFGVIAIATLVILQLGPIVSCKPPNNSVSSGVIDYTNSFCWSNKANQNKSCYDKFTNEELLEDRTDINMLFKVFQYLIVLQVGMFIIPWAYWHFRVGTSLVGQIKYMQTLLKEIYERIKRITRGLYNDKPYDEYSTSFNGNVKFHSKVPEKQSNFEDLEDVEDLAANLKKQRGPAFPKLINQSNTMKFDSASVTINKITEESKKIGAKQISGWKQFIVGGMRDRHLFSMLCYENFASLEYLPYILSVFKATKAAGGGHGDDPDIDFYDLDECILYQWCHRDNFTNVMLVLPYMLKHIVSAIIALTNIVIMTWLFAVAFDDIWFTQTTYFRCYFENKCIPCVINKKEEVLALFIADYVLLFFILFLSIRQWWKIRSSEALAVSHYFEKMKETCNVSFLAAYRESKKKEMNEQMLNNMLSEHLPKLQLHFQKISSNFYQYLSSKYGLEKNKTS